MEESFGALNIWNSSQFPWWFLLSGLRMRLTVLFTFYVPGSHFYSTENLTRRNRIVVHLSNVWEIFTCGHDIGGYILVFVFLCYALMALAVRAKLCWFKKVDLQCKLKCVACRYDANTCVKARDSFPKWRLEFQVSAGQKLSGTMKQVNTAPSHTEMFYFVKLCNAVQWSRSLQTCPVCIFF